MKINIRTLRLHLFYFFKSYDGRMEEIPEKLEDYAPNINNMKLGSKRDQEFQSLRLGLEYYLMHRKNRLLDLVESMEDHEPEDVEALLTYIVNQTDWEDTKSLAEMGSENIDIVNVPLEEWRKGNN